MKSSKIVFFLGLGTLVLVSLVSLIIHKREQRITQAFSPPPAVAAAPLVTPISPPASPPLPELVPVPSLVAPPSSPQLSVPESNFAAAPGGVVIRGCSGHTAHANFRAAPTAQPSSLLGVVRLGEHVIPTGETAMNEGISWIKVYVPSDLAISNNSEAVNQDSRSGQTGWIASCFNQ